MCGQRNQNRIGFVHSRAWIFDRYYNQNNKDTPKYEKRVKDDVNIARKMKILLYNSNEKKISSSPATTTIINNNNN